MATCALRVLKICAQVRFSPLLWILFGLAAVPEYAHAQTTNCTPPGVPFSYSISGEVTDETLHLMANVPIYGVPEPVVSGSDGRWNITVSGCTLSPPRCGTGFNARLAPVRFGFFFTPSFGELCPSNVIHFVASPAAFVAVSGASYRNALSPGAVVAVFGTSLASGTESASSA